MLYKILDLLQHAQIKFVFLATSMKHDVADSFEKRIKSRFSHKQVLFYDLSLDLFKKQVSLMLEEKQRELNELPEAEISPKDREARVDAFHQIRRMTESGVTHDILAEIIANGVNYEVLLSKLKIAFSYLDQKLRELIIKGRDDPKFTIQVGEDAHNYLHHQYNSGIGALERIQSYAEFSTVLTNLPKAQIIVLIFAFKKAINHSSFNFETIYQSYQSFMKSHKE